MRRFRWTRESYRHAKQLARLLNRYLDLPDHPPAIVRRYWELWERYPERGDPLLIPLSQRRQDSEIPF
jgi:hypothetical protein